MSRTKVWTACLGPQLSLYIDAFLEQDAFQEGVLVTEHQTFISGMAMSCLQVVKIRLMNADGLLQLLDVLCPAFTESCLSLAVTLLPLLWSSIDLPMVLVIVLL
jgi:hypothetical protein